MNKNMKQFLHGLFIAIGTAVLPILISACNSGTMPTGKELCTYLGIALGAGGTYILKNYILGSGNTPTTATTPDAPANQLPK